MLVVAPGNAALGHGGPVKLEVAGVREIADQGTGVDAACRIVILEDQLAEALELNQRYERGTQR
jgi:hypothetical protein